MRRFLVTAAAVFALALGVGIGAGSESKAIAEPCEPICSRCKNGKLYFCCQCNPAACWWVSNSCEGGP